MLFLFAFYTICEKYVKYILQIITFYTYEDKRWFKALSKKFDTLNKKFDYDELKNQDSFSLAQEIIECPIEMSLKNLLSIGGN